VVFPVDWLAIQQSPQEYRTPDPKSPAGKEGGNIEKKKRRAG